MSIKLCRNKFFGAPCFQTNLCFEFGELVRVDIGSVRFRIISTFDANACCIFEKLS